MRSLSVTWGHSKKKATCKPGRGFLVDTDSVSTKLVGLPSPDQDMSLLQCLLTFFFQLKRKKLNLGKSYASSFPLTKTWQCSQKSSSRGMTEQGGALLSASATPSCLQDGHDGVGLQRPPWSMSDLEKGATIRMVNQKEPGSLSYSSLGMTTSRFHSRHPLV